MTATASTACVAREGVVPFVIAVCIAATTSAAAMENETTLLQTARSAGQAQSAVIFGWGPPDAADASAARAQESEGAPASGQTDGRHSTKVVVVTAVVTSLATAALTYLLLRAGKPCIVRPEMEYFAPRGYPFLVPLGISPAPRGCVFGRPE